jgi:hypothetical protein
MTRLIDDVREMDPTFPADMPMIVADDIQRILDDGDPPEELGYYPREFYGCIAPPWPECWIEAESQAAGYRFRRGMLVADCTEEDWYKANPAVTYADRSPPAGTRWCLSMIGVSYIQSIADPSFVRYGQFAGMAFFHLDAEGYILTPLNAVPVVTYPQQSSMFPGLTLLGGEAIGEHSVFALKALSILHQRPEVIRVRPTRQQRRYAVRKGDPEPNEYYLLKVQPKSEAWRSPKRLPADDADMSRARHSVRGHFRYYFPERPLFGRYSGMVWVPSHERGSPDAGEVRKGYKVVP